MHSILSRSLFVRSAVVVLGGAVLALGVTAPATAAPKWKLDSSDAKAASKGIDPENAANEVIEIVTSAALPDGAGVVSLNLKKHGLPVGALKNMISAKYRFTNRTCSGGSPRIQIQIQANGQTRNAFGYFGDKSFGGGCPEDVWVYEDMTNSATKWDISQFGGSMTASFADMVTFINSLDPNHKVLGCSLVDDSGSFAPTTIGTAHYDNIQCYTPILDTHRSATGK